LTLPDIALSILPARAAYPGQFIRKHPPHNISCRPCSESLVKTMNRLCLVVLILLAACQQQEPASKASVTTAAAPTAAVTAADALKFMQQAETRGTELFEQAGRTEWLAQTFINSDTQALAARANQDLALDAVDAASRATQFSDLTLDSELDRKMMLLKLSLVVPPPNDIELAAEQAEIDQIMRGLYGTGEYCRQGQCYSLDEMGELMASSRDVELLRDLWAGWREVSPPMRPHYQRAVEIGNAGAKDLGFADLSDQWRSKYDMAPEAFSADIERQWELVKPLYKALHCEVRAKLHEHYGDKVMADAGMIPAHLLGNMWAQSWDNIYDMVAPPGGGNAYDLNQLVEDNFDDAQAMVKTGEAFFTSLGFDALPETFWQRSQFTRPRDRDVVCHASAWNIDAVDDVRIKMCIKRNAEDFSTIHHELGHNFYQIAFNQQPYLFRGSANDGFHEAIGDTVALSITPAYLVQLGLLEREPPVEEDLGFLMDMALQKVAFLPFALVVDKWRWQVFSGELATEDYNAGWWKLREQYQGVVAPVPRSEADFDPGAKYHIPDSTPYMRYFLAHIQQFQFHRALCDAAGYTGPLHRCSIYNNKTAGKKLQTMMAMGRSQPWQDAMEAMTGQRELDATAMMDYFAPLKAWLDEQNQGRQCGW
jgi:peptidyl-dipeptidase A